MGIQIINNFDVAKQVPLDSRQVVTDETARLALTWQYKGLRVRQTDTDKHYEYIGDGTTNLTTDWRQIIQLHRGAGVPAGTLGFVDDVYIDETNRVYYLKTASSTWTSQFTFDGSQILISSTDPPNNADGNNGDISIYNNGKVWKKVAGAWAFQFNIAGAAGTDGDRYATTSTTSIDLSTAAEPLNITVEAGLAYTVGQEVEVVSASTPADNLTATIVSYDSGTGAMVLEDLTISGTGTHTDWVVNLSGSPGKQGKSLIHTEHDITLTQAKITSVEGGSYTPQNPWNASILNDTRSASELTATAGIQGSMVDHSISYDGSAWYDNGLWRGRKGDKGDTGNTGATGATGAAGQNAVVRTYEAGTNSSYTIPTETVVGNYEIYVNYRQSANEPRIYLPSRTNVNINYKVFINLSSTDGVERSVVVDAQATAGLGNAGIMNPNGTISTGYRLTAKTNQKHAAAFYLAHQANQESFWIADDFANQQPVSPTSTYNKAGNFTTYSQTTSRNYPSSGANPNISLTNTKYTRPRVAFKIQAITNTSDHDNIELRIERSTSSTFSSGVTVLKTSIYRVSAWAVLPIEVIDENAPKSPVYYRLVVIASTTAILSTDYDCVIHQVPYGVE